MKKYLLILLLIIFSLPAFAEYKPIPAERSAEYKAEIEHYVKKNATHYIKQMDKENNRAKKLYASTLKNKKNKDVCIIKLEEFIRGVDSIEFNFYRQMIVITMKYVDIENNLPQTDWVGAYIDLLTPYLKDNKISNTGNISSISFHAYNINKEIEKLIECLNKTNFQ